MYTIKEITEIIRTAQTEINEKWVAARPINYKYVSILNKIKDAWMVLTGKADAIMWEEGR